MFWRKWIVRAVVYGITGLFGHGALGPLVVGGVLVLAGGALVARRIYPAVAPPATS